MQRAFVPVLLLGVLAAAVMASVRPARADDNAALANAIAAEQVIVISTDDQFYTQFPHDSMKLDPLTGLPFARDEREEFAAAIGMNFMLRNPHHTRLLHLTATAFPILERSIIGVGVHFWKTPWH
ncbi:MAG TPA: hypothetical protein VEJ41_04420 [Candidatus Acidoferrales bacterium]|nr:hypothetical protein [Candidatus Acidoferrales bacterium]